MGQASPAVLQHREHLGAGRAILVALGGLLGLASDLLQTQNARLKLQVFRTQFEESQFLLNVASGPAEHLNARARPRAAHDRAGGARAVGRLCAATRGCGGSPLPSKPSSAARPPSSSCSRPGPGSICRSPSDRGGRPPRTIEWAVWCARPGRAARPPPASARSTASGPGISRGAGAGRPGRADRTAAARRRPNRLATSP